MSLTQSSIIVLHLTKYGDSSMVVHTIDSTSGRCSYLLRGIGKNKKISQFHPLALLDIVSSFSPKSSLGFIKEYVPCASLDSLRSNLHKSSMALFISEVLYRSVCEQSSDERLFNWLCTAIETLENCDETLNFHLWFLVGFCTVLGFGPSSEGVFDGSEMFQPESLRVVRQLSTLSFDEAMKIKLTGSRRSDFCEQIIHYLSFHLGVNLNIRSLDVLHELYL